MRKTLSDRGVAALKPRPKRRAVADPELRGHWIRVQPSGAKSYVAVTRTPDGKQVWTTIGPVDRQLTIEQARERAREILGRVRAGLPAIEMRGESFAAVASNWVKRYVEPNGLRSRQKIIWLLDRHVLPAWQDREFVSIKRSDVAALLDHIEDEHGARQADYVLTTVRSIMSWYATRHDEYAVPLVRGMQRQSAKAQARARILNDDELRIIWRAAEADGGAFGAIVRLALLTAQRSRKVGAMRWADIDGDEWIIPAEPREKDTGGTLILPEAALDIIWAQPRIGNNPHVFAGRGDGAFQGWGKWKTSLDRRIGPDVAPWVIHDLRRTARSLMSRAGVRPDIAERVLGHSIQGVEGVYDRHRYTDEKRDFAGAAGGPDRGNCPWAHRRARQRHAARAEKISNVN